jgi:hypothetical protein
MAKRQVQSAKKETVESIQVSLRIDMKQAESLIRDLTRAYGEVQLRDWIHHALEEETGKQLAASEVSPLAQAGNGSNPVL